MNKRFFWGLIFSFASTISLGEVPSKITASVSKEKGCLGCHEGIEEIREPESIMLMQTLIIGKANGDSNGCVTCHRGNTKGLTAKEFHQGPPKKFAKWNWTKNILSCSWFNLDCNPNLWSMSLVLSITVKKRTYEY